MHHDVFPTAPGKTYFDDFNGKHDSCSLKKLQWQLSTGYQGVIAHIPF